MTGARAAKICPMTPAICTKNGASWLIRLTNTGSMADTMFATAVIICIITGNRFAIAEVIAGITADAIPPTVVPSVENIGTRLLPTIDTKLMICGPKFWNSISMVLSGGDIRPRIDINPDPNPEADAKPPVNPLDSPEKNPENASRRVLPIIFNVPNMLSIAGAKLIT